jgi:ATP-binding protein involved in chromosome partitioning
MDAAPKHSRQPLPGVKNMLAVSSGKGGVGKSTISANLAASLARRRLQVGLMDADIYGPNIPGMLGLTAATRLAGDGQRLLPAESRGLKVVSMGLLIDRGAPVIWRGPMLAKMTSQFLFNVEWGELDILVLDLPPGTGDVQITLIQSAPLTGALIVTTPSDIALEDVRRGVEMFRQAGVPILGLVENMSYFVCSQCHQPSPIFGQEGGQRMARDFDLPLLARIPLDSQLRQSADAGSPLFDTARDSHAAQALEQLTDIVVGSLPSA